MSTFCSLCIHFAGCKCWARYSKWPFRNLNMYVLVIVSQRNYSFTALFAKYPRILLFIEINANCRFCMTSWFGDEAWSFRSEVVYLLRTIRFNISFLFCFQKLSFAECRSKKANLYSVKSGFFRIWHIVSSVAQRQNVVNFHKFVCS